MSVRIHTLSSGSSGTSTVTITTGKTSFGSDEIIHGILKLRSIAESIESRLTLLMPSLLSFDLFPVGKIAEWSERFKQIKLSGNEPGTEGAKLAEATLQLCCLISCVVRPTFKLTIDHAEKRGQLVLFDKQIKELLRLSIPMDQNVEAVIKEKAEIFDQADVVLPQFAEEEELFKAALDDLNDVHAIVNEIATDALVSSKTVLLATNGERKEKAVALNASLDNLDDRLTWMTEDLMTRTKALVADMKGEKANKDRVLQNALEVLKK